MHYHDSKIHLKDSFTEKYTASAEQASGLTCCSTAGTFKLLSTNFHVAHSPSPIAPSSPSIPPLQKTSHDKDDMGDKEILIWSSSSFRSL